MRMRLLVACLASTFLAAVPVMSSTPNIVVLMTDQQGAFTMLNDQVHAPNMKRLQQSGVGFTNAYSVGLVCVPSRTSILTGRHPATFAAVEDSQEPVIADNYSKCKERPETFDSVLKARGYRVFYYGKWHAPLRWAVNPSGQPTYENGVCMNGGTPLISDEPHHRFRDATNCLKVTSPCRYLPFSNLKNTPTFCKRLSTRSLKLSETQSARLQAREAQARRDAHVQPSTAESPIELEAHYRNRTFEMPGPHLSNRDCRCINLDHPQMASARRVEGKGVGAIKPASLFNTSEEYVYTQAAVAALRSLAIEPDHAPFALTLSLHSPHGPPETFEQFISAYPLLLDWMSGSEKVAGVTMEEIGTALYHAQVSQSDFLFGLLLEALGELKLRQSTLVLFFSDHGATWTPEQVVGNHYKGGVMDKTDFHNHFAERVRKVPLILSWPGVIRSEQVVSAPVSLMDVHSTILAGVRLALDGTTTRSIPEVHSHGTSLWPLIALVNDQRTAKDKLHNQTSVFVYGRHSLSPFKPIWPAIINPMFMARRAQHKLVCDYPHVPGANEVIVDGQHIPVQQKWFCTGWGDRQHRPLHATPNGHCIDARGFRGTPCFLFLCKTSDEPCVLVDNRVNDTERHMHDRVATRLDRDAQMAWEHYTACNQSPFPDEGFR